MDNYVKDLLNYRFVANTIPAVSELNKPQSISTKKSIAMKEEISLPQEVVMNKILEIRGAKVMLDSDLAELYDVKSIRLREHLNETRKSSRNILCFN